MRVDVTPMKNRPSKRGSLERRARSQARWSSSIRREDSPPRTGASPETDIVGGPPSRGADPLPCASESGAWRPKARPTLLSGETKGDEHEPNRMDAQGRGRGARAGRLRSAGRAELHGGG